MLKKLQKIQGLLTEDTAALFYTEIARKYLTGFSSSLGYLFVTPKKAVLFVDGRYYEAATKKVDSEVKVEQFNDISKQAKPLLDGRVKRLLVETSISVSTLKSFENMFKVLVEPSQELEKAVLEMRLIKTSDEIESIIKAQGIAEKAFEHILGFIKPGVSENQIAAELEYKMKLLGSSEPSFKTIAITGKKTSMPHGEPDDTIVKNGDFVTMDFGAIWNGYHSDMTRTVAVGFATDKMKNIYDTVLKANISALDKVRAGITAAEVDLAARDIISATGYEKEFSHSTGHGVGLQIHEAPNVSFKNENPLKENQIITIEPGIYLSGEFGVRIEDMVVVTKNGCNNLTKAEKTLIIL